MNSAAPKRPCARWCPTPEPVDSGHCRAPVAFERRAILVVDVPEPAAADLLFQRSAGDCDPLRPEGIEPGTLSPREFTAFVEAEIKRWAPVVKASGTKAD